MNFRIWAAGLLLAAIVGGVAYAATPEAVTGNQIRRMGLEARLDPAVRDARIREIAKMLTVVGAERVDALQGDFQYALLLQCDPEIYDTLSPETIAAVDAGLEALFDLDAIDRDNRWEALIYVYGFFNRDVTPETIRTVLARWDALSDEEKAPRYPTYVHVIDAISKPVSMGALRDHAATREALTLTVPALKRQFLQGPKPGTAFHPPSHACLVLVPLYERWIDDRAFGPFLTEELGDRAAFEALMASQLPGAREGDAALTDMEYGYYAYLGAYLANALARLDARSTVPALERALAIYEARSAEGRVLDYTRRALVALGAPRYRADFELVLKDPVHREASLSSLAWLARHGQGETKSYALARMGGILECPPERALDVYFEQEHGSLME